MLEMVEFLSYFYYSIIYNYKTGDLVDPRCPCPMVLLHSRPSQLWICSSRYVEEEGILFYSPFSPLYCYLSSRFSRFYLFIYLSEVSQIRWSRQPIHVWRGTSCSCILSLLRLGSKRFVEWRGGVGV